MAQPKKPITVSNQNVLYAKRTERGYDICESDWERLKKKLQHVSVPYQWIAAIASALVGAAITCAIDVWCLVSEPSESSVILTTMPKFWIAICCGVAGILLYWVDYEHCTHTKKNVADIIDDMNHIESRFTKETIQSIEPQENVIEAKSFIGFMK